jgi:hypothetical protein
MIILQIGNTEVEFFQNRGRMTVKALNERVAIKISRRIFRKMREPRVVAFTPDGLFTIEFKVSFDYRSDLLRRMEQLARISVEPKIFQRFKSIEQYMLLLYWKETEAPSWADLSQENIAAIRGKVLLEREISRPERFVDYEVAVYNYIEKSGR